MNYSVLRIVFYGTLPIVMMFILFWILGFPIKNLAYQAGLSRMESNLNVTPRIETIAENLNRSGDYATFFMVKAFVDRNITPSTNYSDFPTPEEVMERGEARCVGKAMLFSSLMRALGYDTQFVFQDHHVCVLVRLEEEWVFYNCQNNKRIAYVS